MQEGKTGDAVKKRDDSRTRVEALLVCPPRLEHTAGHLKPLGRLTLGDTLGVQITIPRKQVSAFDMRPALVAILIATLLVLDDGSHSSLLFLKPLSWENSMAKDGEGARLVQPFTMLRR